MPRIVATCICGAAIVHPQARGGETSPAELGLVPKPLKLEMGVGSFSLTPACKIVFESQQTGAKATAEYLAQLIRESLGYQLTVQSVPSREGTSITLSSTGVDRSLGEEAYRLEVNPKHITISALGSAGLFYGIQTLRQLLPAETFRPGKSLNAIQVPIACLSIDDHPRFGWRGMHLDVSRHFFDVNFVKRYIDNLAMHKMNVFHWHLSDDDGWRVEIKKYPKLTEVGAWRGPNEALPASYESGNQRYGGYYAQDQIREVVRYAAERHVLVVPEIDVPAHCRAVTVSYPELLCAGDPYKFKSVQDVPANVLCPSQDKTYEFLDGVFGELAELFPGPYLHAGGDERPKGPWEQCERCQARMKKEKLANGGLLQDRFLKQVQDIIRAHGKKMMGWDELEQPSVLDKDYTVMAWQSVKAGIAAAKKGYPVIMAPASFTYFDQSFTADPAEPGLRWAGIISLEKAYSFDPKPKNLDSKIANQIRGVHGGLWAETLVTPDRPDYMLFPRLCALAEIGWTPQSQRTWPEFWNRVAEHHFARLDATGILYRIPPPTAQKKGKQTEILPPYPGAIVRYTLDGSEPGPSSTLYTGPLQLWQGATLKMQTVRPDGRASRVVTFGGKGVKSEKGK